MNYNDPVFHSDEQDGYKIEYTGILNVNFTKMCSDTQPRPTHKY